ncbi:SAVED domain-containing protein [Halalkalibacter akibai]|nr:SAVED domain-containing protein [Halalkalibacter akibai]
MLYIILVILVIGAIIFFRNMVIQKKEQGYAAVLFTTGIVLITNAFGTFFDNVMQILTMLQSNSVEDSLRIQESFSDVNYTSLFIGVVLLLTGWLFSRYIQNKMFILNINGYYDRRIEGHHNELSLSTFEFKEREVDFVRLFKINKMTPTLAATIGGLIEEKVKSYKEESRHFQRGYTGIAPIPFIALAGTQLKREKFDKYYEFDKIESQSYYSLKTDKVNRILGKPADFPELTLKTDISKLDIKKKEAVIAISVTQNILDADLKQFAQAEIVNLSLDGPCDNAIRFERQLISYRNQIVDTIYAIKEQMQGLELIHIVYSGQSCLALEIGKSMEDYRMPAVVMYQYSSQDVKKYPWGIKINGQNTGSFIQG